MMKRKTKEEENYKQNVDIIYIQFPKRKKILSKKEDESTVFVFIA